jgi:uncharacterized protein YkwD
LRKLAAAVLALPILLPIYLPIVLRRSIALRVVLALGVGTVLGLGALGIVAPRQTVAVPASTPAPVATTAFGPVVRAGVAPNAGLDVTFSQAMDRASVAAAVTVTPAAAVALSWDSASRAVTIRPASTWTPATLYSITVGAGATDASGHQLGAPVHAAFVTRAATHAKIEATTPLASGVAVGTAFTVSFDRPVDIVAAQAAFHIAPAVKGTMVAAVGPEAGDGFTFTPAAPLDPDVAYQASLDGLIVDVDGAQVASPDALTVTPVSGPHVVRFRPRNGTTDIVRDARLSVRFTQPMNHKTTKAAWSATANGAPISGTFLWGENDTVMAFLPSKAFPAGAKIVMTVGVGATSTTGVPLDKVTIAKATVGKPTKKTGTSAPPPKTKPISHGGTVGSGSWYAVETYYLKLMNCTRTGGWVTSSGSCSSPGGLSTPPIVLDAGLSNKVSRPYAKLLATGGACDHFINGTPTDRLHRAGYSGWAAENIGCRAAPNGFASVLGTHLFFQAEKPCGGYCHYANLMNPAYKKCGIGVWIAHGRVRLVIDFYHS